MYSVIVTPDGQYYMAKHPALFGCMSYGRTVQEAIENLADVRTLYLAALIRRGLPVPEMDNGVSVTWEILS